MYNFGRITAMKNLSVNKQCIECFRKYCSAKSGNNQLSSRNKKSIHEYRKMHPWKSLDEFSQCLCDNKIYNQNGLVALNKPYGISSKSQLAKDTDLKKFQFSLMHDPVEYTISDSLPYIAAQLGYKSLDIIRCPEKFTSGVTLLSENKRMTDSIHRSLETLKSQQILGSTYWVVTTRVPKDKQFKQNLAMRLETSYCRTAKKPVIVKSWSKNEERRREVDKFFAEYQVLSNSTGNLSSLVEIKISQKKWHLLRVFMATVAYSPILGDNLHAGLIQKLQGTWVQVSPFAESTQRMPKLEPSLLNLLQVPKQYQVIVPVHIHLKTMCLPNLYGRKKNLTLEAPLPQHFEWTCKRLQFKNILQEETEEMGEQLQIAAQ